MLEVFLRKLPFSPGFKFGLRTRRVFEPIALSIGNLIKLVLNTNAEQLVLQYLRLMVISKNVFNLNFN